VQHSVTGPNGDTEGLPVAIVEAMASALPVLSTRHSGIPEVVLDGETGLLVDEHDVSGMAEAMATLLGDTNRARAMGEAGRRRVLANFTHDHVRDRLRAIMGFPPFTGTAATLETAGLD
jgi:glycosyltransferase involved in cell wall biosynthesis